MFLDFLHLRIDEPRRVVQELCNLPG